MKVETLVEQLLFATLRIQTSHTVGTGFVVSHKWGDNQSGPFLVTNKHVVEGSSEGHLRFTVADQTSEALKPTLGKSTSITLSEKAWEWTGHPSEYIDVAVLPLAPAVNHLNELGRKPYYRSIPTDLMPSQSALDELDAVEEVLFVGYPSGIFDNTNNLPIVRRGSTATHPSVHYEGKPVFLIDASVFQGSSGSPVLIHDIGSWRRRDGALMAGQRSLLLGILSRAFFRETDGTFTFEEVPAAVKPVVRTNQMIDLGIVYKASTILEAIEHALAIRGLLPQKEEKSPESHDHASQNQ